MDSVHFKSTKFFFQAQLHFATIMDNVRMLEGVILRWPPAYDLVDNT
jgi:hypothetical protein